MPPKNKTPSIDTLGERESLPKSAALGGTAACRADLGPLTAKLLEQQREIARLTAERDDVRREYCRRIACPLMDITDENDEDRMEWKAREIADKFKWDCFGGAA